METIKKISDIDPRDRAVVERVFGQRLEAAGNIVLILKTVDRRPAFHWRLATNCRVGAMFSKAYPMRTWRSSTRRSRVSVSLCRQMTRGFPDTERLMGDQVHRARLLVSAY